MRKARIRIIETHLNVTEALSSSKHAAIQLLTHKNTLRPYYKYTHVTTLMQIIYFRAENHKKHSYTQRE